MSKYDRTIIGTNDKGQAAAVTVDVYQVLSAFTVTDPALQHLIKKALCVGMRGHKDELQDLTDILESASKAFYMYHHKKELEGSK